MRNTLISLIILTALSSCVSKRDVLKKEPILDREFKGNYIEVAACTLNGIQTSEDYNILPSVNYVPVESKGYIEIQTTASSDYLGTIYGAITRFDKINNNRFRLSIRSGYSVDADIAIKEAMKCINGGNDG